MAGGSNDAALNPVELMRRYLDSLPQDFSVHEEIRSPKFWKALRAELLSSLLLVVFVTGASEWTTGPAGSPAVHSGRETAVDISGTAAPPAEAPAAVGTEAVAVDSGAGPRMALAYTLTAATLVQCMGNVSGAHANPAVTLGMLVCRLVSPLRAAAYVVAQLAGGLLGALILFGLTPAGEGQDQVRSCSD